MTEWRHTRRLKACQLLAHPYFEDMIAGNQTIQAAAPQFDNEGAYLAMQEVARQLYS